MIGPHLGTALTTKMLSAGSSMFSAAHFRRYLPARRGHGVVNRGHRQQQFPPCSLTAVNCFDALKTATRPLYPCHTLLHRQYSPRAPSPETMQQQRARMQPYALLQSYIPTHQPPSSAPHLPLAVVS